MGYFLTSGLVIHNSEIIAKYSKKHYCLEFVYSRSGKYSEYQAKVSARDIYNLENLVGISGVEPSVSDRALTSKNAYMVKEH